MVEESKQISHEGMHIISQGAEGRIYLGDLFGMKCIVKERFQKKYRVPALDEKLTKQRIMQNHQSKIEQQQHTHHSDVSGVIIIKMEALMGGTSKGQYKEKQQPILLVDKDVGNTKMEGVFKSIQSAINAAEPGSIIKISPGLYEESLLISNIGSRISHWSPRKEVEKSLSSSISSLASLQTYLRVSLAQLQTSECSLRGPTRTKTFIATRLIWTSRRAVTINAFKSSSQKKAWTASDVCVKIFQYSYGIHFSLTPCPWVPLQISCNNIGFFSFTIDIMSFSLSCMRIVFCFVDEILYVIQFLRVSSSHDSISILSKSTLLYSVSWKNSNEPRFSSRSKVKQPTKLDPGLRQLLSILRNIAGKSQKSAVKPCYSQMSLYRSSLMVIWYKKKMSLSLVNSILTFNGCLSSPQIRILEK